METIDHVKAALERLPMQHQRENWQKLIRVIAGRFNGPEAAFHDLLLKRSIDSAEGVYLDRLASLVGVERGGLADDELRAFLRVAIRINKSAGTPDDILEIMRMAVGPLPTLRLAEYPPAAFELHVGGIALPLDPDSALALLAKARAAAVDGQLVWNTADDEESFAFDGDGPGLGFDDEDNPGSGGQLAGAAKS